MRTATTSTPLVRYNFAAPLHSHPCGVGKSWLACALGNKACRDDFAVAYHRVPRLFTALALGRADGRYAKMLRAIARLDLLILDDWGPEPLDADQRRDLLEIVEDRYEARSIIITSQLPVDRWYEAIVFRRRPRGVVGKQRRPA